MTNSARLHPRPTGFSKLERAVLKHRGMWYGQRRKVDALLLKWPALALFDRLVGAVGRRGADVIWKRGERHVHACLYDPYKYQNEPASRPS